MEKKKEPHSLVLNPLFKDAAGGDYTFRSKKNICKIGFEPFDYSKAGVYGEKVWIEKTRLSAQKVEKFKKLASLRLSTQE